MNIDRRLIEIIPAEKNNEKHKKRVLEIFNQNINFFNMTNRIISYEEHSKWWDSIFKKEKIYLILFKGEVQGYIRLSKMKTISKEKHEMSIALASKNQNCGIGSIAYQMFEKEMKKKGIKEIVAKTMDENKRAQNFFEKNNFQRSMVRYIKKI